MSLPTPERTGTISEEPGVIHLMSGSFTYLIFSAQYKKFAVRLTNSYNEKADSENNILIP
jgi:hypothetical protein